tara:strand:+ start:94 stop:849 length:756 start_codon:yes stop_codon:yes gene_type:complete
MKKLVLLRHGESEWNLENRFTGWTDVSLTEKGIEEAKEAGKLLKSNKYKFDIVYTSVLKRAIQTMEICLNELNCSNVNIKYNWRLNERHYGGLQGLNKIETAKKHGKSKVKLWRRSYEIPPPPLDISDKRHPRFDKKYKNLKSKELPNSESLKDTFERIIPLWNSEIAQQIKNNNNLLIIAHGNSLRAIIKYLDNLDDNAIVDVNIPTGIPLIYELDNNLKSINHFYLCDEKILIGKIDLVANQTNKSFLK